MSKNQKLSQPDTKEGKTRNHRTRKDEAGGCKSLISCWDNHFSH